MQAWFDRYLRNEPVAADARLQREHSADPLVGQNAGSRAAQASPAADYPLG